ncbi:MAG: corrinoid protein [Peptostreptococcaceae bacterium]
MDFYEMIRENIKEGEAKDVINITKKALALKYPPENILNEGLIKGINIVAEKFKSDKVLVPEVLMSTRALHAGLSILSPYLSLKENKNRIKIVIGTVAGDLHDIGKNIVKILMHSLGIEVVDLGIDVSTEDFIEAVKKEKPDILMMSALLTTTMNEMKLVIEELEKENLRDKVTIFVGGSPVSEEFSEEIGADYYIEDAMNLRDFIKDNLFKFSKNRNGLKKVE